MGPLQRVWNGKCSLISLHTKIHVYRALVMSVLLHGAETWTLLSADLHRLGTFHVKCMPPWEDRVDWLSTSSTLIFVRPRCPRGRKCICQSGSTAHGRLTTACHQTNRESDPEADSLHLAVIYTKLPYPLLICGHQRSLKVTVKRRTGLQLCVNDDFPLVETGWMRVIIVNCATHNSRYRRGISCTQPSLSTV